MKTAFKKSERTRDLMSLKHGDVFRMHDALFMVLSQEKRGITKVASLAQRFGVSQTTISRIVRGAGWNPPESES